MAILKIDEIPTKNKKTPKRELVRRDIQEAIDKGITQFEFVGEEYNYSCLSATAREVAHKLIAPKVRMKFREIAQRKYPFSTLYSTTGFDRRFYEIKQQKETDRIHIYMRTMFENMDEEIEKEVDAVYKKHCEYEERKKGK